MAISAFTLAQKLLVQLLQSFFLLPHSDMDVNDQVKVSIQEAVPLANFGITVAETVVFQAQLQELLLPDFWCAKSHGLSCGQ